jgi:hypothetical protein
LRGHGRFPVYVFPANLIGRCAMLQAGSPAMQPRICAAPRAPYLFTFGMLPEDVP